jgi:hypothetical protein
MKPIVTIIILIALTSCIGSNDEIDREIAIDLVDHFNETGKVDSVLLEKSNAFGFYNTQDFYLFVNNGWQDEFSGEIYSPNKDCVTDTLEIDGFYVREIKSVSDDSLWTKVAGLN